MQPRLKFFRVVFPGVVVVAVVIAAVMALSGSSRRDPVCNGIRLSEILRNERMWGLHISGFSSYSGGGVSPTITIVTNYYTPREQEYFSAFHSMGEAAWPILLSELQAKDSKMKSWLIKRARFQDLFRIKWVSSEERSEHARSAILELMTGRQLSFQDPSWRGIEEFRPTFRRECLLDLIALEQNHLNDPVRTPPICFLLDAVGTNAAAAIPVLKEAVRAGEPFAAEALEKVKGGSKYF